MSGESIEDVLADIGIDEEIPEGATVRSYEDDVYVGQEFVLNGVDIAEFTDEEGVVHHPRRRGQNVRRQRCDGHDRHRSGGGRAR